MVELEHGGEGEAKSTDRNTTKMVLLAFSRATTVFRIGSNSKGPCWKCRSQQSY